MIIALFSECYTPIINGVVVSIRTLRSGLRAEGHRVYLFAPGKPRSDDDEDVFRLPVLPFPRHPYRFARPFPRLPFDFSDLNVDLIHCQHPFTVGRLGAELARHFDLPMVYTAHSLYDQMVRAAKSPLVRKMGQPYARGYIRRFSKRADHVIAPSNYVLHALQNSGVSCPVSVIPTGVSPPCVTDDGRGRIRKLLMMEPDDPLLLYVGRLGPEKRVDLLIESVEILNQANLPSPLNRFKLAIVGDGQYREKWQHLAERLGIRDRIYFAGMCPHEEIGDWYASGDLFLMPAPAETQGLVLVEAMGVGLPSIAVMEGGAGEAEIPDKTGILTAFDPAPFAKSIINLLKNRPLRENMALAAKLRAEDYRPERMVQGVLKVYEEVMDSHPFYSMDRSLRG